MAVVTSTAQAAKNGPAARNSCGNLDSKGNDLETLHTTYAPCRTTVGDGPTVCFRLSEESRPVDAG